MDKQYMSELYDKLYGYNAAAIFTEDNEEYLKLHDIFHQKERELMKMAEDVNNPIWELHEELMEICYTMESNVFVH